MTGKSGNTSSNTTVSAAVSEKNVDAMIDSVAKSAEPAKVIDLDNSQEDKSAAAADKELDKIRAENSKKDDENKDMEN